MTPGESLRPRGVWKRFLAANARFAEGRSVHPRQDEPHRLRLLDGQAPHAAIVSCSDSRIVPEIIFDQGLGDLFVIRVAGNVLGQVALASVEYAVGHLRVPLVIVLAHSSCGAVTATLGGGEPEGHLGALIEKIAPAAADASGVPEVEGAFATEVTAAQINRAARANAQLVARRLRESEPIIAPPVARGATEIVAAYYDMASGRVDELTD